MIVTKDGWGMMKSYASIGFTDTLTEQVEDYRLDDGDHERFAHYVFLPKHLEGKTTAEALVMEARVNGTPVQALCGKKWIPARDPKRFPVCPDCDRIKKEGAANGMERWK